MTVGWVDPENQMACDVCHCNAGVRCSRCKLLRYCGKDHQRAHWAVHKAFCHAAPQDVCEAYVAWPREVKELDGLVKGGVLVALWNSVTEDVREAVVQLLIALVEFEGLAPHGTVKGGQAVLGPREAETNMEACAFINDWVAQFRTFELKGKLMVLYGFWRSLGVEEKKYMVQGFV